MVKLVVCYIIENDEDIFRLSFDSIKDVADHIVVVDGNQKSSEKYEINLTESITIIDSPYLHKDIGANGKQRNIYLNYLKEHHIGDWCLVLDADEVVDDRFKNIKTILESNVHEAFNVHMRHLVQDFAHEDNTQPIHFCPARLFKVTPDLSYPEVEHPVLQGFKSLGLMQEFTIWHLGYAREMLGILKKYNNHLEKSNIHSKEFLRWWYVAHLTGQYPKKQLNLSELPSLIKERFKIATIEEEEYFSKRMEMHPKFFLDSWQWKQHFNPQRMIEVGCGVGHRVFASHTYGIDSCGFDVSQYAINNSPYQILTSAGKLKVGSIVDSVPFSDVYDLVVCYDVLEHIDYDKIDTVIENVIKLGNKNFLFSIPFLSDPNLERDNTHKIKESRDWWIGRLTYHGLIIKLPPENFLFKDQLLIGEK